MDAYKLIDAVSVAACEQGSAYGLLSVRTARVSPLPARLCIATLLKHMH